jgi:hypothetical protein
MKKFMTAASAAMIALALSMPAWSQNTQAPASNAPKASKQDSKTDKKDTSTTSKSTKKSKKKKGAKDDSKTTTPAPASTNKK